jgi:hypothetical protein
MHVSFSVQYLSIPIPRMVNLVLKLSLVDTRLPFLSLMTLKRSCSYAAKPITIVVIIIVVFVVVLFSRYRRCWEEVNRKRCMDYISLFKNGALARRSLSTKRSNRLHSL